MNAGLMGPILVSSKGSTKPDGTPKDVDREFITAFAVFDETEREFIHSVFDFADTSVREVMTPRTEIHTLEVRTSCAAALRDPPADCDQASHQAGGSHVGRLQPGAACACRGAVVSGAA